MAAFGAGAAESGEHGLEGKSVVVHSDEVAEPAETVDAKQIGDWEDLAAAADGFVGDISVGGEADAEDVAETSHDETLKASKLMGAEWPGFGAEEESR